MLYVFNKIGILNLRGCKDKVVCEYGIGGAYLGVFLFENYGLKRYIGVDIAERSIEKATENLQKYNNKKLMLTDEFYKGLDEHVDIFVSQATIQHFPDEEYLINFLKTIKKHGFQTVMLQIAHCKGTIFSNKAYDKERNVVRACRTNKDYILRVLDNYSLTKEHHLKKSDYCFLIFEKN